MKKGHADMATRQQAALCSRRMTMHQTGISMSEPWPLGCPLMGQAQAAQVRTAVRKSARNPEEWPVIFQPRQRQDSQAWLSRVRQLIGEGGFPIKPSCGGRSRGSGAGVRMLWVCASAWMWEHSDIHDECDGWSGLASPVEKGGNVAAIIAGSTKSRMRGSTVG